MHQSKILIAEDDPCLLQALAVRLEAAGYEVICAADSYQAVDFARHQKPELLILDIHMPAGNGFTILQRLKKVEGLDRLPVIFLTGDQSPRVQELAAQFNADALIHKPFEFSHLLEAVQAALAIEPIFQPRR
ncbi:MAG: response regulator [Phycisphaerae bacterium]|nr:response regulator [Phycisphaerae bacterium]